MFKKSKLNSNADIPGFVQTDRGAAYSLISLEGNGLSGSVYKAKFFSGPSDSPKFAAVKVRRKEEVDSKTYKKRKMIFDNDAAVLESLPSHPSIIRYLGRITESLLPIDCDSSVAGYVTEFVEVINTKNRFKCIQSKEIEQNIHDIFIAIQSYGISSNS